MTSLWRHLWPNYDTLDFKILTQCVKMLGERVLQVWRWYLHRFRRYRKKTRGGARNSPPPSGARVNFAILECSLNVWIVNKTVFASPELCEKYAAISEVFTSLPQMTSHKPFLAEISNINIFHITLYFGVKTYKPDQWNLPNILAYISGIF